MPQDKLLREKVARVAFEHFDYMTEKDMEWQASMPEEDSFAWLMLKQGHQEVRKYTFRSLSTGWN